jgi:hypothetical protein
MLREAVSVPNGLRVGPVYVNGELMPGADDRGTALYLHPADDGHQHSESLGMRDYLDTTVPRFLAPFFRNRNYAEKIRSIPEEAEVHPSVRRRFALPEVQQADGLKPYRPEALRSVTAFASYYPKRQTAQAAIAGAPARGTSSA